jgi:diazepam-binding inhibitor (GABA receptor modulating acyl-CoA-binding protein)
MDHTTIIDKKFNYSCVQIKRLREKPNDFELLSLYGYYKQAINGDNNTSKPSFLQIKDKKKWAAWESTKGMSCNDAKINYYNTVNKLIAKYGIRAND